MMKKLFDALRWAQFELTMWAEDDAGFDYDNSPAEKAIEQYKFMKFHMGDKVRKISGAQWKGTVVGFYSTTLTPEGYAVESDTEIGSVQIYPAKALEVCDEK